MALLLYLRSNTAAGMFSLPAAIGLVTTDPRGSAFLSALVLVALGVRFALHAMTAGLGLVAALAMGFVLAPVEAALVLLAFGLCGLFVRSKARLLRVACDEDDWEPGVLLQDHVPPPAARPAPPSQPIALSPVVGEDGQALLLDEIPAVTGQLLAETAPPLAAPNRGAPAPASPVPVPGAASSALEWPWDEPAAEVPLIVGQAVAPAAPSSIPIAAPQHSPAPARAAATQIMGSIQASAAWPERRVDRSVPAPIADLVPAASTPTDSPRPPAASEHGAPLPGTSPAARTR
jgi:hypothetical protein